MACVDDEQWWSQYSWQVNIPRPCGKFRWISGSVTGHNIDMNPYQSDDDPERFNPFLNLSRLDIVIIQDINVSKSFMIDTKEFTPSLFTI